MKKTLLTLATTALIFSACTDKGTQPKDNNNDHGNKNCITVHKYHHGMADSDDSLTGFISIDSGNKMIGSYLKSIDYTQNDTDLYSLIYSADSLRSYLSNPKVTKIKFMFAHTLEYINNGGLNQYAGYQSGALTLVLAGYDSNGNYVFYYAPKSQQAMAMDHLSPCPNCCPRQGTAASPFLVNNPTEKK